MNKDFKPFVKDGDEYIPRLKRQPSSSPRSPNVLCACGGKLIQKGATGIAGELSSRCNKCSRRVYNKVYKGKSGLSICY